MVKKEKEKSLLRLITMTLVAMMVISCVPMQIFAETGTDAVFVYNELKDYLVKTDAKATDGYIGIPVDVAVYLDPSKEAAYDTGSYHIQNGYRDTIFYVINWNGERIGQESDLSILSDYISQGYVVITVDYKNHEKAKSPDIEHSLASMKSAYLSESGNGLSGVKIRKNFAYFLPAGYRLKRDISYFDIDVHASLGAKDHLVKFWNTSIAGNSDRPLSDGSIAKPVTSFEELTDKYGIKLDTKSYLDIVYPSDPKVETPVFVFAATAADRHKNTCDTSGHERVHFVGFTFSGYTAVNAQYTWPLHSFGVGFGLNGGKLHKENGVKSATATIRCVRSYAEELGYSEDYIGVAGISKGSPIPAILGVKNNATLPEYWTYESDPNGDKFEGGEDTVQPFMTYPEGHSKAGEPISSEITVAYSAAGDGTRWFAEGKDGYFKDRTFVPMLLSCGVNDEYNSYDDWDEVQDFFADVATEPYLAIDMDDKGHDYPVGYGDELGYDRYSTMIKFFDYYMKPDAETSELVWPNPKQTGVNFNTNYAPDVKFLTSMNVDDVIAGLSVTDSTGKAVPGSWEVSELNSRFTFVHAGFDANETYTLTVADKLLTADGVEANSAGSFSFTTKDEYSIEAIADAYVSEAEPDRVFGSSNILKINGNKDEEKILFATFKTEDLVGRKFVNLKVIADSPQVVSIFALDGYTVDEETLCYNNMPSLSSAVTLGEYKLTAGENILKLDKLLKSFEKDNVTLVFFGADSERYTYSNDFEKYDPFSCAHKQYNEYYNGDEVNRGYSETAIYRTGGASTSNGIVKEDGEDNQAIFITGTSSRRIKLFNILEDRALTSEDVGRTYRISFRVKYSVAGNVRYGWMSAYSQNPTSDYSTSWYSRTDIALDSANKWENITVTFTIDQTMVDQQISMLTIQPLTNTSGNILYVDDVVSTEIIPETNINSKESGAGAVMLIAGDNVPLADISWYDPTKTDQYLSDAADLWGLWGMTVTGNADFDAVIKHVEKAIEGGGRYASESAANCSNFTAGKVFHLTANIDLNGVNFPGFAEFSGSIDGHGYSITGFSQNHTTTSSRTKHSGFIRNMTPSTDGETTLFIRNLRLEGQVTNLLNNNDAGAVQTAGLIGCITTNVTSAKRPTFSSSKHCTITLENLIIDVDVTCIKPSTLTNTSSCNASGVLGNCAQNYFDVSMKNVIYEGTVIGQVENNGKIEVGTFLGYCKYNAVSFTNCLDRGYAYSNACNGSTNKLVANVSSSGYSNPNTSSCINAVSKYENGEIVYKSLGASDINGKTDWYLDEIYGAAPAGVVDSLLNKIFMQTTEKPDENGRNKLRIIGTLNSLDLSRLEMDVYVYIGDANADSPSDDKWHKINVAPQNVVFTSIYAAGEIVTADDLGGEYLYGFVLSDIPEGATVSVRLTPKKVFENGDTQALRTRTLVVSF